MADYIVRLAGENDAAQLGIIGPASYAAAYGYLWPDPAQLATHLASFGEASVREGMARDDTRFWLVESGGTAIGFAMVVRPSENPTTSRSNGCELRRMYLLSNVRGLGLGRQLFDEVVADAKEQGCDHIWLDVMDTADWAYATYLRWGFLEIGARQFDEAVYPDRRGMIVLAKDLD
jgi:GNAT superfamily N-acetyltransferase